MYATIGNQLYHFLHFLLAMVVVYVMIPRLLFNRGSGTVADYILSNFVKMTCFVILVGYVLVMTKLLEVIGFVGCVAVWAVIRNRKNQVKGMGTPSIVAALFFDLLEGPRIIVLRLREFIAVLKRYVPSQDTVRNIQVKNILFWSLWFVVFGVIAFTRFYDAFQNSAPAMSDGYVTLAWLKYVNERILFHDGIYPQGLYMFMDMLLKFSFINPLYVMKYTGPLDSVLTALTFYFVVFRLSASRISGLIAASVYGVFGSQLLFGDYVREAATNSQEFGFLFILPTFLFLRHYLDKGNKADFWATFAGLSVTGLTHVLSYGLNVIGVVAMLASYLMLDYSASVKRVLRVILAGFASCFITLSPFVAGKLLGVGVNQSAQSYSQSTVTGSLSLPTLHFFDKATVIFIGLLLVFALVQKFRGENQVVWMFASLFGLSTFFLNEFGGWVTHSTVLISRTQDLWALTEALVIGIGISAGLYYVGRWRFKDVVKGSVTLATGVCGLYISPNALTPIVPYKMQWNDGVEAYLEINQQFKYNTYLLVAPGEEYALVLGDGYQMSWDQFTSSYNPDAAPLTRYGASNVDSGVSKDVFIYVPKTLFEVSHTNSVYPVEAPIYQAEKNQLGALHAWLSEYQRVHGPLNVFYDGPHLTVYHLQLVSQGVNQN